MASCTRGKATPDSNTQRELWAACGGFCQNPACNTSLFRHIGENRVNIGEMAHIFAASKDGPRSATKLTDEEKGAFENIILLCPVCHTIIDKAEDKFPDSLIRKWKHEHTSKIQALFGSKTYSKRIDVHNAIQNILEENHVIFDTYGPHNEYRYNPESEIAGTWCRKVIERIIPNNRRIISIINVNRFLLKDSEQQLFQTFCQHVDDLEARHLWNESTPGLQFPKQFSQIYGDNNE